MDLSTQRGTAPQHDELSFELQGTGPALVWNDEVVDRAELRRRCDEVGVALGAQRRLVLVPMRNDLAAVVAYLGARRAGHVVVLCGPEPSAEVLHRWRPDAVVHGDGATWQVEELQPGSAHELHPELAVLLSTSGSTGSPRCVRLSAQNLSSNAVAIAESLSLRSDDRALTTLPLHYCYGLSVLHSHLAVGAAVVLAEHSVVDPCCWDTVARRSVTTISAVPHMLDLMERADTVPRSAPSLRRLTVAGGRAAPDQVRRFAQLGQRHGWDLYVMYGQTEATARMACLPPELVLAQPGAIGRAVPGGRLDLVPVDGSGDDVGELVYRGANVMMGYAERPADLARGAELEELRTGDLARRVGDDLFELVGRRSRIAKLFGLRIDLDHLERRLDDVGLPAWCVEHDGALAVAAVVGGSGRSEDARRTVAELSGLPVGAVSLAAVSELAHTDRGKPDRSAVAARAAASAAAGQAEAGAAADAHHDTVERSPVDAVAAIYRQVLGCTPVRPSDSFVGLGGDSLSYVEVSLRLEALLGRLPAQWHVTPIAELAAAALPTAAHVAGSPPARSADSAAGPRHRGGWAQVETSLVLRALAILAVVSSHAGLVRLRGGAHLLLAIAGFNFARFLLRADRPTLRPATVRSIARIAVPASVWLALVHLTTTGYHWAGVALLNSYLGPAQWTSSWRYWFVEAQVLCLLVATLLTTLPALRRIEARRPVLVPAGLFVLTLVTRFDLVTLGPTPEPLLAPHRVAWCFVLGWLIARSSTRSWRWVATAATLVSVPGFFGEPSRDAVVVVGLLLLIWVPTMRVPRRSTVALGLLASASLYVYLSHYQVFMPLLAAGLPPWSAVLASIAAGVVLWRLADPLVDRLVGRLTGARVPS